MIFFLEQKKSESLKSQSPTLDSKIDSKFEDSNHDSKDSKFESSNSKFDSLTYKPDANDDAACGGGLQGGGYE